MGFWRYGGVRFCGIYGVLEVWRVPLTLLPIMQVDREGPPLGEFHRLLIVILFDSREGLALLYKLIFLGVLLGEIDRSGR